MSDGETAQRSSPSGRVTIVTGAAAGMGATIAQRAAADGARVVATDRDSAGLDRTVAAIEAGGGSAVACVADLLDPGAPEQIVAAAVAAHGSLDSLVCCAGIIETAPLEEVTLESFERQLAVNLRAPLFLIKAARRYLGDDSAVVCIASQCAVQPTGFQAAYAASKGGLVTLVQSLAAELGPDGIRVNAVSPGATATAMSDGGDAEEEFLSATTPDRRIGRPDDIADAVLFLLSDAASHIHAANLMVDGGFSRIAPVPPLRTDVDSPDTPPASEGAR